MYRLVAICLLFLIPSCATHSDRQVRRQSWCFEEYHRGASQPVTDFYLSPVRQEKMAVAIGRLRNRTVIRVSREQARDYTGRDISDFRYYYIIRGNITSEPNSPLESVIDIARNQAGYELHWSASDQSIILSIWQTVEGLREDRNVGFVLGSSVEIQHTYVACWVMD